MAYAYIILSFVLTGNDSPNSHLIRSNTKNRVFSVSYECGKIHKYSEYGELAKYSILVRPTLIISEILHTCYICLNNIS